MRFKIFKIFVTVLFAVVAVSATAWSQEKEEKKPLYEFGVSSDKEPEEVITEEPTPEAESAPEPVSEEEVFPQAQTEASKQKNEQTPLYEFGVTPETDNEEKPTQNTTTTIDPSGNTSGQAGADQSNVLSVEDAALRRKYKVRTGAGFGVAGGGLVVILIGVAINYTFDSFREHDIETSNDPNLVPGDPSYKGAVAVICVVGGIMAVIGIGVGASGASGLSSMNKRLELSQKENSLKLQSVSPTLFTVGNGKSAGGVSLKFLF